VTVLGWAWRADSVWFQIHMLPGYCSLGHDDRARHALWRWGAVVLGIVLLGLVRPRIARWAGRKGPRETLATLARFGVATVLALATSEVILRVTWPFKRKGAVDFVLPPAVPDARLTWVHEPNTTTNLLTDGRNVAYFFDAHGWRVRAPTTVFDFAKPTLLVVGESVAAGLGVNYDESFPAFLEDILGVQVVDTAVHGYGHNQSYLRMLDALPLLERPVAVVTMEFTQELERDVDDTRATLRLDPNGALVLRPPDTGWTAHSGLCELWRRMTPYHDDSSIAIAHAIFADTIAQARRRGAYPLFVEAFYHRPCVPEADGTVPAEERMFAGLDADLQRVQLDPAEMVKMGALVIDEHPNGRSHRKIADVIVAALQRAHVVAAP
jgi:hypothetical protein